MYGVFPIICLKFGLIKGEEQTTDVSYTSRERKDLFLVEDDTEEEDTQKAKKNKV